MALYAFDGTGNADDGPPKDDTNVVRFREVYAGADFEYLSGVGTRLGGVGKVLGGLFGMGGRSRIDEMYDTLCQNYADGDHDIDIIGFSRGAALAVHFANKIAKDGIKGVNDSPTIRFLGLWDMVASFGLSFNNILQFQEMNLFWDVETVPDIVQHCFHAMAYDERREAFNVTRLDAGHSKSNVEEQWFRGVHSDVGGGNGNVERSNIALQWMIGKAIDTKLPINKQRLGELRYRPGDGAQVVPIFENKDLKTDPRRKLEAGDSFHESFDAGLDIDESRLCRVVAERRYNWSGVSLKKGARYSVEVPPGQTWEDDDITCGPTGWETEDLGWVKEKFVKFFEDNRRQPKADWFVLIAALGDEDDHLITVGDGVEFEAPEAADLYFFANDLKSRYGNNDGFLNVITKRIG